MACLRLDSGGDYYATVDIAKAWTNPGSAQVNLTEQRTGRACLRVTGGFPLTQTIGNKTTLIAGTAFKCLGSAASGLVMAFCDGPSKQGVIDLEPGTQRIRWSIGVFQVGAIVSSFVVQVGIYYRLELKVFFHATLGTMQCKVNGVTVLSATNINTGSSGHNYANVLELHGAGGGDSTYHDDIYLCDDTGAVNNDFMGDIIVVDETPNADGIYKEWTPLAGVDHFAMVNEIPPDGNASYNSSSVVGQRDTYKFPATGISGLVLALQINIDAEKDTAGNRLIAPLVRQGVVDAVGTDFPISQDPTYTIFHETYDINPATGLAWALADVTTAEFGQKVTG